ncbi:hypothetical protein H3C61_00265 [Candidatus Gracilibacteria bacterium]|nr:hypothetical protein [Candidatus Gracilibacteria bacterium]
MEAKRSTDFYSVDENILLTDEKNHLVNNTKSTIVKGDLKLKIRIKEANAEKVLTSFFDFLDEYIKVDNLVAIDYDVIGPGDIININFFKDNNKKNLVNLKILIFQNKTKKVVGFIKITDFEKNITSQTKIGTIIMPIIQYGRRGVELSLKGVFYILMKDILQEKNIKDITLYKKIKQKDETLKKEESKVNPIKKISNNDLKNKNRIIDFFSKKIFKLIKK